ncbi:hypothetical protein COPR103792_03780 [Corynebacterium propinquum]
MSLLIPIVGGVIGVDLFMLAVLVSAFLGMCFAGCGVRKTYGFFLVNNVSR